jgi:prevent-host-death family protein
VVRFGQTSDMTVKMSLHKAKARLSHVVALAEAGESVELTRHGKVVAIVTGAASAPRKPGSGVGTVVFTERSTLLIPRSTTCSMAIFPHDGGAARHARPGNRTVPRPAILLP